MENKINVSVVKDRIGSLSKTAVVVPQYSDKCCLFGVSGTFLRSRHFSAILDYELAAKCNALPYGYCLTTDGRHGVQLMNVSLLDAPAEDMPKLIQVSVLNALIEAAEKNFPKVAIPCLMNLKGSGLGVAQMAKAVIAAVETFRAMGAEWKMLMLNGRSDIDLREISILVPDSTVEAICHKIIQNQSYKSVMHAALCTDVLVVRQRMLRKL